MVLNLFFLKQVVLNLCTQKPIIILYGWFEYDCLEQRILMVSTKNNKDDNFT